MAPPVRLGKGPIVNALDEFLDNPPVDTINRWLKQLREQANNPTDTDTEFDTFLNAKNPDEYKHLMHDVFGFDKPGWDPSKPSDKNEGTSRRRVYAAGVAKALEKAYGIGPTDPIGGAAHRRIDTYWGCGQPFNQVIIDEHDQNVVIVHVWSTAAPPGLSPADLNYLSPGTIVVDDHKGLDEHPSIETV
jgi:hypothetical protein